MAEPSAIWSMREITPDKSISLTQNVILSYARDALRTVINRIGRLHELARKGPITNAAIDPDIPPLLSDLIYQQGLASLLLFSDEDVLLHFDNEIKLSDLRTEAEQVSNAVWRKDDVSYHHRALFDLRVGP